MDLLKLFKEYLLTSDTPASAVTVKNYIADVNKFVNWYEEEFAKSFDPNDVSQDVVDSFKKQFAKTSPRSTDRYLSSLRKFMHFLLIEGKISSDPFQEQKTASLEAEAKEDPWRVKDFKSHLYVLNSSHLTIKNYVIDVKQFLSWVEEVTGANEAWSEQDKNVFTKITYQLLEEYKRRLTSTLKLSPASVNRKLSSLRRYLTWAQDEGLIKEVDLHVENLPKNSGSSVSEEDELIEVLPQETKAYSKIPPVRLAQKTSKGIVKVFDATFIASLAAAFTKAEYIFWKAKGKPVFEASKPGRFSILRKPGQQIQRKPMSIRNIPKGFYAPAQVNVSNLVWYRKIWFHARFTRPRWYKFYASNPLASYFHYAVLMLFMTALGFGLYNAFLQPKNQTPTFAALPTAPPRILSFQGRLTDANDTPITTTTNMRYAIYNHLTASGSALLWQEVVPSTPDTDGIFATLLGANSGNPIPASVFGENAALYLGVTISSTPELAPRQQLATVAFASNSETLQGLLPSTGTGAGTSNVVLALDSSGNLSIGGSATPTFQATGGQFRLLGQPLVLGTNSGSNGNVVIDPDGLGKLDIRKPLVNTALSNNTPTLSGAVEVNDLFAVIATSSGQSAVTINQDGAGPILSASASGAQKFTVENTGRVVLPNNIAYAALLTGGTVADLAKITSGNLGQFGSNGEITTSSTTSTIGANSGITTLNLGTGNSAALTVNIGTSTSGNTINIGTNNTNADTINIGSALDSLNVQGTIDLPFANNGGILYTNGSGVLAQTTVGSSGQCLQSIGGGTPTWGACGGVSADSLDFVDFQDQLDLDASTDILADGSEVLSITNSGTGNSFLVNDTIGGDTTPFVIDADGEVGIGTTAPAYPLDIRHSGYFAAHFQNTTANASQTSFYLENDRGSFASYGGFLYGSSTGNLGNLFGQSRTDKLFMFADGASNLGMWVGTLTAQPFVIGTNNVEVARVTGGGSFGIGTTTPDARLEINHATGDNLRLTYNDTDGSASNYSDFSLASDGDLTIDSSGGNINLSDPLAVTGAITGTTSLDVEESLTAGSSNAFNVNSLGAITAVTGYTGTGNFGITGSGTFSTGTGAISLNGDTTVSSGKRLIVGTTQGTEPRLEVYRTDGSGFNLGARIWNASTDNTSTGGAATAGNISFRPLGNQGAQVLATGTSTGQNVGGTYMAGGANTNFGGWFATTANKNSATNVAVLGFARNTGTSPIQVGGYFGLNDTMPTFTSAALIADNAAETSPIFLARDNGSTVFTIADGGNLTAAGTITGLTGLTSSGTITLSGLNGQNGVVYGTQTTGVLAQATTASSGLCLLSGASAPIWGSCAGAISADSLDFDDFEDVMNIDAATDINLDTFALSIDLDSTGDFSIRDVTTEIATFADSGAITFAPTSGQNLAVNLGGAGDFIVNTDDLLVDTATGNVGIGTTSPLELLQVGSYLTYHNGGFKAISFNAEYDAAWEYLNTDAAFQIEDDTTNDVLNFKTAASGTAGNAISWNYALSLTNGGSVGSGTTAPDAKLEINHATGDNLRLTYNDANGSATNYTDLSLASDGDLTIDSSGSNVNIVDPLAVTGAITGTSSLDVEGALTAGSSNAFNVNSSGAIAAATGITSSGTVTLSSLNGQNGVVYGTQTTGVLAQATTSTASLCLLSGASAPSWGSCSGAITGDSFDFDEFEDQLDLDASTDILADGSEVLSITNSGTGNSFLVNDTIGGDATPFVIDTDGNVGIGDTTPDGIFDVTTASSNYLFGDGATSGQNPDLRIYGYDTGVSATRYGKLSVDSAGTFDIDSSNGEAVSLANTAGYLNFMWSAGANAEFFAGSTSGENRLVKISGYDTGASAVKSGSLSVNSSGNFVIDAASSEHLSIQSTGGNVGIGTTAPDAALEINHATGDNLRLTFNDANGSATNYTDFLLGSDGDLTIDSSGSNIYIVDPLAVTGAITGTSSLDVEGALTAGGSNAFNVNSSGAITASTGITTSGVIAANGGSITSTGALALTPTTTLSLNSTGDMTLDSSTDIIFDADGADFIFKDSGTTFATLTNSSTDLTMDIAGGQLYLADTDVFNVGGLSAVAYNALANSGEAPEEAAISSDNDLYVGGDLEVDGTIYGNFAGTITPGGFTSGSIIFAGSGGTLTQDNSNFFWDDTNNRLGIGDTTPDAILDIASAPVDATNGSVINLDGAMSSTTNDQFGLNVETSITPGSASSRIYGATRFAPLSNSANLTNGAMLAFYGAPYFYGTGTLGTQEGGRFVIQNGSTGTISNAYGARIANLSNSGTITNTYGIHVGDITTGTQTNTPYSLYASDTNAYSYFAGRVGVGTTSPTSLLHTEQTSTVTSGSVAGNRFGMTFTPSGTTTGSIFPVQMAISTNGAQDMTGAAVYSNYLQPVLNHTGTLNQAIGNYADMYVTNSGTTSIVNGFQSRANLNSSVTGNITTLTNFSAASPTFGSSATGAITTAIGLRINAQGNTLGSSSITGGYATYGGYITLGSQGGNTTGTNNNYGLRLSGNGGTAGTGGTVNNYSIYSDSAAQSYFAGNLGLGVTGPAEKLDVSGSIRVATGNSIYLGSSATSGDRLRLHLSSTNSYIDYSSGTLHFRPAGGSTNNIVFDSSGNVGVGTTTTAGKFTVEGSAASNPLVNLNYTSTGQDIIVAKQSGTTRFRVSEAGTVWGHSFNDRDGATGDTPAYYLDPAATGTSLVVAGKVGIGTTSVGSTLTVAGNTSLTYSPTGTGTNIALTAYGSQQHTSGTAAGIWGTYSLGLNSINSLTTTEAIGVYAVGGVDSAATGTVTNAYGLRAKVQKGAGLVTNAYGVYIDDGPTGGTTRYGLYQAGSNDNNYFAGKLGIGTASPRAIFNASSGVAKSTTADTTVGLFSSSDATNQLELMIYLNGNSTAGSRAVSLQSVEQNVAYRSLLLNPNGGSVGIGTTAPSSLLHVVASGGNVANIRVEDATNPRFSFNYNAGGTNAKKWQNYAGANILRFTALNDAENSETSWLEVSRSGQTPTQMVFPNGVVSIGGASPAAGGLQVSTGAGDADYGQVAFIGSSYASHFNLGTNQDTYIRPGTSSGRVYMDLGVGLALGTTGLGGQPLAIYGTSNNTLMTLVDTNSGATGYFGIFQSGGSGGGNGSDNEFLMRNDGAGFADNAWTTPADYAEFFETNDTSIGKGELVALDPNNSKFIKKAEPNDPNILGIVSTKPGIIGVAADDVTEAGVEREKDPRWKIVGLMGQVPTKVSTENGPILVGDYLTSSSIPGVAMKATKPGRVVAKALEKYNGSGIGKISSYVAATWYDPDVYLTNSGSLNVFEEGGKYFVKDAQSNTISRVGAFSEAVTGTIRSGFASTQKLLVSGTANIQNLVAGTVNATTASFSTLTTSSLAVATDAVTIGGTTLRDYIAFQVDEILNTRGENQTAQFASPIDEIVTDAIKPNQTGKIAIKLEDNEGSSKLEVKDSTDKVVGAIDSKGNLNLEGKIKATELELERRLKAQQLEILGRSTTDELDVKNDATVSGNLKTKKLIADEAEGGAFDSIRQSLADLTSGVAGLKDQAATRSSELAVSGTSTEFATISAQTARVAYLDAEQATFTQGIMSLGGSSFTDVGISNILSVGSQLVLADTSINVLGSDLELQPLKQGGIKFLGGKVYIDTEGNVSVEGNAYFAKDLEVKGYLSANVISPLPGQDLVFELADKFERSASDSAKSKFVVNNASKSAVFAINQKGDVKASGSGTFAKLNLDLVGDAVAVSDTELTATGSAGTAKVNATKKELTINNKLVTDKSLIYITPVGTPSGQTPYLLRQVPGESFTIGTSVLSTKDTFFNWLIIN